MRKIHGLLAVSMASLALAACGSGGGTADDATTQQSGGTSEMMGGDSENSNPNLGTAQGQSIDDVDVKMTPNTPHSPEEMTGAEELKAQKPDPQ